MRLKTGKHTVGVISDLQIPYEHPDALEFVEVVTYYYECDKIVCIGDEVDQLALSRYDTDPEADGAGPELKKAIKRLQAWYELFPEVSVCISNHTGRVQKAAFKAGIPEAYLRPVNEWLEAPEGWTWADYFEIDGVRYEHGDNQGGMYAARNIAIRNRQSTVIGHHHSHGGVYYVANDKDMIFGCNSGCLIDAKSIAFKYARGAAFKPTLGMAVVVKGIPSFVPMIVDARGRWTGEVLP